MPGGTATSTTINASGTQAVSGGGIAEKTTVNSGGTQAVLCGGTATSTTINAGGAQIVSAGGQLEGTQTVNAGGSASGGSVADVMSVESGGIVTSMTVVSGGVLVVRSGATANNVMLEGGELRMAPGAHGSGIVGGFGSAEVCTDDTCASVDADAVIPLGGENNFSSFIVSSGVLNSPNGFQVNSSGGITVISGGTLSAGGAVVVENGGALTLSAGGTLSAASVSDAISGSVSMSGGRLAATGGIVLKQSLTNGYGILVAGTAMTIPGASMIPSQKLSLSAGTTLTLSGETSATEIAAGGDISAAGQAISVDQIRASGVVTAGKITALSISAGGTPGDERPALRATSIAFDARQEILVPEGGRVGEYEGGQTVLDADGQPARKVVLRPIPPIVRNVSARQRWPWNGLVDVDYEIDGHDSLLADLKVRIVFMEQGGAGRTWTAKTFLTGAEPSTERGAHRATWDAKADGAADVVADVTVAVELVEEEDS